MGLIKVGTALVSNYGQAPTLKELREFRLYDQRHGIKLPILSNAALRFFLYYIFIIEALVQFTLSLFTINRSYCTLVDIYDKFVVYFFIKCKLERKCTCTKLSSYLFC